MFDTASKDVETSSVKSAEDSVSKIVEVDPGRQNPKRRASPVSQPLPPPAPAPDMSAVANGAATCNRPASPVSHLPVTPPPVQKAPAPPRSASPRGQPHAHIFSLPNPDDDHDLSSVLSTTRSSLSMLSDRPKFGTKYSTAGSIRDDESLASSPSVPNYMTITQSARAKVRSHSTPKQRPDTPEKEMTGSAKKRLSFPTVDTLMSSSGPMRQSRSSGYAQRSPSLRSIPGPIKTDRSLTSLRLDGNGDMTPGANGAFVRQPFR